MTLLIHRFRGEGLYILDEPEAALSPQRQLAFLSRMHDLIQQGSQFIIATHSPIIMAYPEAWIYELQAVRSGSIGKTSNTLTQLANSSNIRKAI